MEDRRRDVWIGLAEASAMLGDPSALDRLIADRRFAVTRIGVMTYVSARDLFPFLPKADR